MEDAPHPTNRRVLVVDDNRDAADTLSMAISGEGFDVRTSYSGLDALLQVKYFEPHVVVMDLNMPRMDGYQAATSLSARRPRPLLIALSADGSQQARAKADLAGFDAHLVKPADLDVILKTITQ